MRGRDAHEKIERKAQSFRSRSSSSSSSGWKQDEGQVAALFGMGLLGEQDSPRLDSRPRIDAQQSTCEVHVSVSAGLQEERH